MNSPKHVSLFLLETEQRQLTLFKEFYILEEKYGVAIYNTI